MADSEEKGVEFEGEGEEQDVAEDLSQTTGVAVLSATDWTTETVVSQLERQNIQLNPKFQRRDAWQPDRKSRFIESLVMGLPIPQIVLAESKKERGKFIVLDGKQRLLSILQFWGLGDGPNNKYALTGLTLRKNLKGVTYADLKSKSEWEDDFNALVNQSIRTVVIRNWRDSDFLHTVFLRLNTESVTLSPQELRQALLPGEFTTFVDDASANSKPIRDLLGLDRPDPRMRDIEILARFLAFRFFADIYPGRMKAFLDDTFERFNSDWKEREDSVKEAVVEFEEGVNSLIETFNDGVAQKPGSRQFNRAIFDALIYFHSQPTVRRALKGKNAKVKAAYQTLFRDSTGFLQAIERDTAGAPNTATRLRTWAKSLSRIAGHKIAPPEIPVAATNPAAKDRRQGTKKKA